VTGAEGGEESAATGARWVTAAFALVGLLNYGYALLLTRLLDVAAYSRFAAGQGLLLWVTTVSAVSVPWVLAQAMVRARSRPERDAAIRFAKLASTGSGVVAAVVVGAVASRFADPATVLALAASTLVLFLGTTTTGWLQGLERMRALSIRYVAENLLKNGAGLLLVVTAKAGDTGALAAFGIGGVVMLAGWPRTRHRSREPWLATVAHRDLWQRALGIAATQGVVALFAATDVVLVTLLPGSRALAASYQASAALARVPLFLAGGVATAFFPSLSRSADSTMIASRAVRMYAAIALPLTAVLMTAPRPVLAVMFPAQYGAVVTLLKVTAVTGLAAGGIGLTVAFFQAADDYACLARLGACIAVYIAALLGGWWADGIAGLAVGGALGAVAALVLLGCRLITRRGRAVLTGVSLLEPAVATGLLILARPSKMLWLTAAALIGLRAGLRFLRPSPAGAVGGAVRLRRPGSSRRRGKHVAGNRAATSPVRTTRTRRVVISSFDSPGNPHYHGGGAAVIEMIARWLAPRYDVTVVTAGRRAGTAGREDIRYLHLPIGWAGPRAGQLLYHLLLPVVARSFRHDVWIENFTPPFSTSFVPLFSRAPVVGFAQSLSGAEMSGRYRIPFFLIERLGLRHYRDVVVLNQADGARIRGRSPGTTVRVIPNGIEAGPLDEQHLGRRRHILFLGRVDIQEKGLDLLLAAYQKSGLTMPLLIAGSGTRREEHKLAALLATADGDIRLLGQVTGSRKQQLLQDSAFVVLPSRHETFGLAALEGMACGKPVLHFDLPTLRWMDGDVRVPPFDVTALAAGLRELADDEQARRERGRLAHAAARGHGLDETAARYLALVRDLIARSDPLVPVEGDRSCQ
jgi:glycosyltransferase involved in cell wall biosynthesis/O-antigen/teichoic acid export membrane protein